MLFQADHQSINAGNKVQRQKAIIDLNTFQHSLVTQCCTHTPTHTHLDVWRFGSVMQLAFNAFSPIKYATQGLCLHFAYILQRNMHHCNPFASFLPCGIPCYQRSTCRIATQRRAVVGASMPRIL